MILNMPFYFCYSLKTLVYKIHIFYYFKLNRIIRHSILYNARSNFSFNRFFINRIVYHREMQAYTAFDIAERIVNFINIYNKKEYRDLVNEYITNLYQIDVHEKHKKKREEYYDYFYFRTFGNYDPELEFYDVQKSRFFTRL
jgi:hypothetical protein